jgi:hypothetical protein
VTITDTAPNTDCSDVPGYSCFGHIVSATANSGLTVSPYLTWFITYSPTALGNINPKQVGFKHGSADPILPGKKGTCGTTFSGDCIVQFTVNTDGSVTFEIRTKTNSTIRGVH